MKEENHISYMHSGKAIHNFWLLVQAFLLGRALYIIPKIIKHSTITRFNNPTCFEMRQLGAMIIPRILWLLCSLHSSCIHVPFCIHIWKKKKLIIIWIIAKKKDVKYTILSKLCKTAKSWFLSADSWSGANNIWHLRNDCRNSILDIPLPRSR